MIDSIDFIDSFGWFDWLIDFLDWLIECREVRKKSALLHYYRLWILRKNWDSPLNFSIRQRTAHCVHILRLGAIPSRRHEPLLVHLQRLARIRIRQQTALRLQCVKHDLAEIIVHTDLLVVDEAHGLEGLCDPLEKLLGAAGAHVDQDALRDEKGRLFRVQFTMLHLPKRNTMLRLLDNRNLHGRNANGRWMILKIQPVQLWLTLKTY